VWDNAPYPQPRSQRSSGLELGAFGTTRPAPNRDPTSEPPSPPPPTALALGRLGLNGLRVALNQQLTTGGFQGHPKFVITEKSIRRVFGQDPDQRVTGKLADLQNDLVRRRQRNMHMRGHQFFDAGRLEGHMTGQGMVER